MARLQTIVEGLTICTVADSLAFPPVAGQLGVVPATWQDARGFVKEFDLEIWAAATANLTAAELFGAVLHPLVVVDDTFTGEADDDLLTATAHGLLTGDGPLFVSNVGGALPAPLVAGTPYYAIKSTNDAIKLATSRENALAGTAIDLTTDGTGTHTLADSADTKRAHWHSHGLLGAAGAIALLVDKGYTSLRQKHRPGVIAYALVATGPTDVSCRAVPVQEI